MQTHWKKLTNPLYVGAYDFAPGEERTLTIKSVKREMVAGPDGKKEECTVIDFTDGKPMICNTTNAKAITKAHGTPFIEEWGGKAITIYVAKVKAFGEVVDALRVRPIAPRAGKPVLTLIDPKYPAVEKFMREGGDIEKVRIQFELSAEIETTLNQLKPKP